MVVAAAVAVVVVAGAVGAGLQAGVTQGRRVR